MGRKPKVVKKEFVDNPHLEGTRDEFISNNVKLVYKVANQYMSSAQKRGLDLGDLVGVGMIGLIKAYDGYDPTKFNGLVNSFSTYAVPKIHGEILREFRDSHSSGLKMSRHSKELAYKLVKSNMEHASTEEIMAKFDTTKARASEALGYLSGMNKASSLEDTVYGNYGGGEEILVKDQLGDNDDHSSILVQEFMESLTEKEKIVVTEMVFNGKKQAEVGKLLGVSQVQISRIFSKIRERAEAYNEFGYLNKAFLPERSKIKRRKNWNRKNWNNTTKKVKEEEKLVKTFTPLDNVKKMLVETRKTYREIAEETGIAFSTVAYYGKKLRTKKGKAQKNPLSTKRSKTLEILNEEPKELKVEEAKIEEPKELKVEEPAVEEPVMEETKIGVTKTSVVMTTGGTDLSIYELQSEIARIMEIITATGASSIDKFSIDIQMRA